MNENMSGYIVYDIERRLRNQFSFNYIVTIFAVVVTDHLIRQSRKVKELRKEFEEFKRAKGD